MAKNTYKQDEVLEEPFDIRHLLRASSYIKKYAGRMVVAILLSGIGGAFGYVAPMIIQRALDLAIPDKNEKLLFSLVGMLVGIYVVSVIFTTIRSRIMVDVSQNIIYDIRKDLFEHLQELPFQYYDDRPHGKILIRVVNYVNSVSDMLSNGLINIVLECFNLLFIVIFMFLVDVQMALVVLCGVPVLCVFMVWIKNKQRRAWQAVSNKNSNLNAYLQENIVGARITQIFAREDENAEIFKDLSQDCRRTWNTAVRYSNLVWPGIDSISVCVRAAIFLAGLVLFGQGSKSLGTIVAISSYASYFWQPIMNLGNIFNNFINNIAYLERIFETMDEPVTVKDAENAVKMPEIRGEVTFDHVNFSYDESKQILKDVSFTVKPGESVALVGPTGVGKTQVSLDVASALNAEILSMDSMQIYRGMDIGTAKSSFEERRGIAHHMIDVADPSERFTVADYRDQAIPIIDDILSRGKQPMLVGGTGLYLDAIRYDMNLGRKGADEAIRLRLRKIAEEPDGQLRLHEMLRAVDPQTAEKLHPNDVRRVMRALEIYETSGKTKSEQADSARAEGKYHVLVYGLSQPREIMYARINARVDEMMEAGLVNEVKALLTQGVKPNCEGGAMQAIGYKEIVSALQGDISMERAVELIKQNSRRYAKRQWTWFRHDAQTKWFDYTDFSTRESLEDTLLQCIQADCAAYAQQA